MPHSIDKFTVGYPNQLRIAEADLMQRQSQLKLLLFPMKTAKVRYLGLFQSGQTLLHNKEV